MLFGVRVKILQGEYDEELFECSAATYPSLLTILQKNDGPSVAYYSVLGNLSHDLCNVTGTTPAMSYRYPQTQSSYSGCNSTLSQLHTAASGIHLPDSNSGPRTVSTSTTMHTPAHLSSSIKRSSPSSHKPVSNTKSDINLLKPSNSMTHQRNSDHCSRISVADCPDPLFLARKIARKEMTESQETVHTPLSIDPKYGIRFASLNVNGCRNQSKRISVDTFLLSHGVHIAVLQEVNLDCLKAETPNFCWYMGAPSNNQKRGLAVLIRHGLPLKVKESHNYGSNVQRLDVVYQV